MRLIFSNIFIFGIVLFALAGCGSQTTSLTDTTIQADTTKPIITLIGNREVNITTDDNNYIDAGATASDDVDGNITDKIVTISDLNTSKAGTYHIRYNVSDSAGNKADEVSRVVNVIEVAQPDTTKPLITLIGNAEVNITVGDNYTDAGATASDDVDGNITDRIVKTGSVDTNKAGAYTIKYNVSDSAGNKADEVSRVVNVIEVAHSSTKAYIPDLDFNRDDVYGNGRVVRVDSVSELENAIVEAKPYTTILIQNGTYEGVYIRLPEGIHHITLKGEGDQTVIVPKSNKKQSAFVLYNALSKETQTHNINFVDFSVEGDLQDEKEFIYVDGGRYVDTEEKGPEDKGRPYGPYNIYIAHISFENLYMGLYSHLYAHDWTVNSCSVKHSTRSHFWYMMGWHLAMINSTI